MKKIMVEIWLDDDFILPEGSNAPCKENNWSCMCGYACPFYEWDDEYGSCCKYRGPCEEEGCPLKKYIIEEE